ncbi:MAG: hypothetical protein ABI352_08525 [Candidatus Dormibacter sp.]
MAAIDVTDDAPASALPGVSSPSVEPDPEARHRLRTALRILLAARRRDDRGGQADHNVTDGGVEGGGDGSA